MLPSLRGLLTPREGVGSLPALLLDRGQLPPTHHPLPFPGRKEINDERFTESGAGEQSTDTKSAIGGTRMSEAATPAVAAGNRVSTTRIVGGAGVALAASVVVQNAVFFFPAAPTYGDPLGEVLAYHAEHRAAVAIAVGLEAVKLPLLLLFVTGLHGLVQRRGGAGADWSRLAVAAGATLSAVFALFMT